MTDQEKKDLDQLHNEINQKRQMTFDYCRIVDRSNSDDLSTMGYETVAKQTSLEQAKNLVIANRFRSATKEIDLLTKAYINKYPDQR